MISVWLSCRLMISLRMTRDMIVSYTAYKGAVEHVLRLHGCLYGQKCASKQFYCALATWLCDNGFKQAKNEPCLFVNEACLLMRQV